jgi:hypothetical protein
MDYLDFAGKEYINKIHGVLLEEDNFIFCEAFFDEDMTEL